MSMDHEAREEICRKICSALDRPPVPEAVRNIRIEDFIAGIVGMTDRMKTRCRNALLKHEERGGNAAPIDTVGKLLEKDGNYLEKAIPGMAVDSRRWIERGLEQLDERHCNGEGCVRLRQGKEGPEVSFSHIDAPMEQDRFMLREGVVIESASSAFIGHLADSANRALRSVGDGSYHVTRLPVEDKKARLFIGDASLEKLNNLEPEVFLDRATSRGAQR